MVEKSNSAFIKFLLQPLYRRIFIIFVLMLVAVYLTTSIFGGGDAYHGHEAAGHFFFAHHPGAPEHEVSQSLFYINLWVFKTLFVSWALGMLIGIIEIIARFTLQLGKRL